MWSIADKFITLTSSDERNKYQEALDYIVCATNGGDGLAHQINILGELVDKATPKELDYEGDGYWNGKLVYDTAICRSCGRKFEVDCDEHYKYCPECGQALKWNESEE